MLRAFEREVGRDVVRPSIAGLMGAFGAALYAQERATKQGITESSILSPDELSGLKHDVKMTTCNGCENHCSLTVNTFTSTLSDGTESSSRRFIGGNRCEKMIHGKQERSNLNMLEYKRTLLASYKPVSGKRGRIGIPMGLNMYELYPFWHTFFTSLGFEVVRSAPSTRDTYLRGQTTIPSDTVCYPAKLIHGHIRELVDDGIKTIFYPCMTYNIDEGKSDNHYNCPVVAYYPEVIRANMHLPEDVTVIGDYVGLHRRELPKKMHAMLLRYYDGISLAEVKSACKAAFAEQQAHMDRIGNEGKRMLREAYAADMPVIILASRPYHADPEVCHGIDKLICDLGAAVITEDSVADEIPKFEVNVLNQWTYHSRMYAAARYVAENAREHPKLNLVQFVSFGCGVDAITTDEIRSILESAGKIYTQIKIDEITNLGTVKIRLRSLFATM